VLGAVQGVLALFVIARYMGDEVLGQRAFALALVSLVGIVARLGFPTTHVRRLARGDGVADSNGAYLRIKAVVTTGFMLLAGAAAWIWFDLLGKSVSDTTPEALVYAYWIVVVQSIRDFPVNSFQGLRHIVEREAVLFTNTVVTVLLTLLVGVAYADSHGRWTPMPEVGDAASALLGFDGPIGAEDGLALLMLGFLVGEAAAFLLAVVLFLRRRIPVARPPPGLARAYLAWTVPIMLLTVGEVATKWLSQVMLGFWWDASELGQFAAAAKLSEAFLLLGGSLAIVILPAVSALHARDEEGDARSLVHDAERWTSLLLWPALVVVALASGPLVHILLSDSFLRAGPLLTILAFQGMLSSLAMPVQQFAIGMGRPAYAARVVGLTLLVDVLLNLLLVPERIGSVRMPGLGALGAAIATTLATLLALVLYSIPTRAWPGHRFLRLPLLKHLGAAAGAYLAFRLLPVAPPERFLPMVPYALAVVALYLALLVLLRELGWADLERIRAIFGQTPKTPPEV
jgi:O-antigen/teichoic acid export membrane protein